MTYITKEEKGSTHIINILIAARGMDDIRDIWMMFHKDELRNPVKVAEGGFETLDFLMHSGIYRGRKYALPHLICMVDGFEDLESRRLMEEIGKHRRLKQIPILYISDDQKNTSLSADQTINPIVSLKKSFKMESFYQALEAFRPDHHFHLKNLNTKEQYSFFFS